MIVVDSNLTYTNPFRMVVMEEQCKPVYGTDGASCADVVARESQIVVEDGVVLYVQYKLGIKTQLPVGWEGIIRPRSSISKYDLIMCNSPATIDSDYRGEWMVRFKVTQQNEPKIYQVGDRVAQITFAPVTKISFSYVDELDDSQRGDGGFGSTGQR